MALLANWKKKYKIRNTYSRNSLKTDFILKKLTACKYSRKNNIGLFLKVGKWENQHEKQKQSNFQIGKIIKPNFYMKMFHI